MVVGATEPPVINMARQRRATLRSRLGPPPTTFEALAESIQQLQGLARDRSEALMTPGKQSRRSRRA